MPKNLKSTGILFWNAKIKNNAKIEIEIYVVHSDDVGRCWAETVKTVDEVMDNTACFFQGQTGHKLEINFLLG